MAKQIRGQAGGKASAAALTAEERKARAALGGAATRERWAEIRARPCGCGCGEPLGPGRLAFIGTTLVRMACAKDAA